MEGSLKDYSKVLESQREENQPLLCSRFGQPMEFDVRDELFLLARMKYGVVRTPRTLLLTLPLPRL